MFNINFVEVVALCMFALLVVLAFVYAKLVSEMYVSVFQKRALLLAGLIMAALMALGGVEVIKMERAVELQKQSIDRNIKSLNANIDKIEKLINEAK